MNLFQKFPRDSFFGSPLYVLFGLILAVPIWVVADTYANATNMHGDEAVATAAAICGIASIFAGRWIIRARADGLTVLPLQFIKVLGVVFIICAAWLFLFPPFAYMVPGVIRLVLYWIPFLTVFLTAGAVVKISTTVNRNKVRAAEAAAEISKSELQLLQSKLSPHFLFNTLNNLYGISITRSEQVPQLLLKLSNLLRYAVYGANEIYVPLKDEVDYFHDYIDFEKIRIGKKLELRIALVETIDTSIKVAPLLLSIFIENAFKHARNTVDKKIYIDLNLAISGNMIVLSIRNSQQRVTELDGKAKPGSGFGLASAKRRLELLYPGQHELKISDEPLFYQVDLQLVIK